ncbi:MAG: polysaccharide deacetylase family protein [Candidatus Pacebacteria bacterium]|nr:polysaccharide deacetylase family protein [Candidatus Paceibacterota bacterium]
MTNDDTVNVDICRWRHDAPFAYSMTYDEGTVDALANAVPIHEEFGFPGHVDVVAGQLGRQRHCLGSSLNHFVHMSADELKILLERGWGVGNHSWSHYSFPAQPGLDLYREVVWSKYRLEDLIEHPVRIFTIPNDKHNYEPVIDLVKQHYLGCAYIEGGPNREGFDLYKIGNCMVASGGFRSRPGWTPEMKTENLTLEFVRDSWVYETSHLVMWNVPQDHKCVTPEYMTQRFEKLNEISGGKLWAATPDDVIDYVLMRGHLRIENVQASSEGVSFDVTGEWPVGVMNSAVTIRVSGAAFDKPPEVANELHVAAGGYTQHQNVESVERDGNDWLITMHLAPHRTVHLK